MAYLSSPRANYPLCGRPSKTTPKPYLEANELTVSLSTGIPWVRSLHEARNLWPQPVPSELKNKIANMFCEQTSSNALHRSTCACCAEAVLSSALTLVSSTDVNLEPLLKDADPTNPDNSHGNPDQYWLDSTGIVEHSVDSFRLQLCQPCMADLKHGSIPRLSLANDTYLGDVPNVLRDLTPIEESMISLCRAKCWIVQLNRIWCG